MKSLWKYLLLGGVLLLLWVFIYTDWFKYPIGWTEAMVGIKAEPSYIPFDYHKSYVTTRSCGKRCNILNIVYEGSKERLVVIATDYVSWADDPKWDKNTIIPGTKYYYQNKKGKQLLFWQDEKEGLELGLEFTGERVLPKEELLKIASSIKADGKQLD